MRNWLRTACILLLAGCLLFTAAAGTAESMHREVKNPELDMELTVGYDGMITYGKAVPMRVTIRNFGGDFEGILGMNAYAGVREYDRYETAVSLPAGTERTYVLAPAFYVRQDRFTAELVRDGEVVSTVTGRADRTAQPSALLVGVLSTRPGSLSCLNIDRNNDTLARYEFWQTVSLTPENFPEETTLMRSFGMLVIDDIDPAALNAKQQAVLDEWLREGGFLVSGGGADAARNAAYFNGYTGLTLQGVSSSDSVIRSLEAFLGRSDSGRSVTTAVAEYTGAEPLVRDAEGRGLLYRTEAGAGRIYTTAFEAGDPQLNADRLMHFFWQQVLVNLDQDAYTTRIYARASDTSEAVVAGGYSLPVHAASPMLPGLLIVAGAPVLACILWVILKKRDANRWMWVLLPLVSVAAAACLLLLSSGAETNRTLAVVTRNLVQDSSGRIREYCGISAASPGSGRHGYSLDGEALRVQTGDYVNYDEEEEDKKAAEPDTLRTCYTAGGVNTVTAETVQPWAQIQMSAERYPDIAGKVTASVWMEEDGLHGEVENGTEMSLAPGNVITTYGYAPVPALRPGEKADILLVPRQVKDPMKPEYEAGGLYMNGEVDMYTIIHAALGYNEERDGQYCRKATTTTMVVNAANQLRRGKSTAGGGVYEAALFLYAAEPLDAETPALYADGKPVERQAGLAMLTAEAAFLTVGRTGIVMRTAGMDVPVRVETDENGMPTDRVNDAGKNTSYHMLNEMPTFRFDLGALKGARLQELRIVMDTYYANEVRAFALNQGSGAWEEVAVNTGLEGPERFLDGEGRLYLQFRQGGQGIYGDVPTPMIILEGRQDNAEN